jgi:hypothetical protein
MDGKEIHAVGQDNHRPYPVQAGQTYIPVDWLTTHHRHRNSRHTGTDPTIGLTDALIPLSVKHRATITEPKAVGALLRAIHAFEGTFVVQCAMQITPYVFVRPGELRHTEWS